MQVLEAAEDFVGGTFARAAVGDLDGDALVGIDAQQLLADLVDAAVERNPDWVKQRDAGYARLEEAAGLPLIEVEGFGDEAQAAADNGTYPRFFHGMLEAGVYLAPSAFEAGFVSLAHSDRDVKKTLDAAEAAFAKISESTPDLIITDLALPGLDGIGFIERLMTAISDELGKDVVDQ